jgi:molecular chaperone GrpE (heat shock protein)
MAIERWEHFFKPEVRSSGRRYQIEGKVSVSQPSDTEIQAFIKTSPPLKVSLKSPSIDDPKVVVDCNCPAAQKGQLCKHIWATLLAVDNKRPDFLEEKTEIEKKSSQSSVEHLSKSAGKTSDPTSPNVAKATFAKPAARALPKKAPTEAQQQSQAAYKAKQNDYRKQQYQKQKERLKARKQAEKPSKFATPSLPDEVEKACEFFSENGFPMDNPPKLESVQLAKKKLARIFHPDIGGSHDEILELNKNCKILLDFIAENK